MVLDWRCCLFLFEKPHGNFGEYLASPSPLRTVQGGDSLLISFVPQSTYLPFLVPCVGVSGCKELSYCSWALSIQISRFLAMNFQQERSYSQKFSKGAISVNELCLIKKLMGNNIWIQRFEEAHKKKSKVVMVGIVQIPPFPDLLSGDRENIIWMFWVTDTTSLCL